MKYIMFKSEKITIKHFNLQCSISSPQSQQPETVKVGDINLKNVDFDEVFQVRSIAEVQVHPLYNSSYYYHDIALIRLAQPVV